MNTEERKKLYRLSSNKIIAGVCAGFAEYLNIDTGIIRIIVTLGTLATGVFPGIITYFIAWIIIPEKK
ncbi:MAG: hypothetical protein COX48_01295 [bacterium (Candidatus Stahlbacteria) CG23_combo_of_CG06-09_8_20_14_all_34_7]|nr:MAG: hypothetical protein COX48_01295 [bacterium (Candidatus Stahlbacteria) CG23_combo_of_CG06-09_8_20_14_all_34_7]